MNEFGKLCALVSRNIKCYFKDKFLFFVSLITPMILLVLFATFLRGVYMSSFEGIFRAVGFELADARVVEGLAGSWLLSSILAVSSVTVAVCSNAVMVNDKIENTLTDFCVTPVKRTTLSAAYFIANFTVTLIVLLAVLAVGLVYLAAVGWCLAFTDILAILADVICSVLFGTLAAAVIGNFISTQGGLSAVSTLVSSLYGFLCGAYMPLSQFADGLRSVICCLPGTYSVGILRNHFMTPYIQKLAGLGLPEAGAKGLMDSFDCNLTFGGKFDKVGYVGGTQIPLGAMYGILLGACAILFAVYFAIVAVKNREGERAVRRPKRPA